MTGKPLRLAIEREGQSYIDEPVYEVVSVANDLAMEIAHAYGRPIEPRIRELTGYKHKRLRWMKPDGKGGFVPI